MTMYLLLCISACCYAGTVLAVSAPHYAPEDAAQHFEDFITKFEKQYANEEEKRARFEIFKTNLEKINRSNKESDHAVFGITQFSDLTSEEFAERHTGLHVPIDRDSCTWITDESIPNSGAPESFDWRSKNVVTDAKNQGTCGSCFSFSAIGHIESQYAIKTGQLLDLSEQQVLDCDQLSSGCRGGYPAASFSELIRLGGSMNEADYPYENRQGQCRSDRNKAVVRLTNCYSYGLNSQEKVKQLLYLVGPLSIAIQSDALQGYHGGIVGDAMCQGALNHAVLLVGYGTEANIPYWIVKNSWGATWGEQGFFRLQRSDNPRGACEMINSAMSSAVIQ